MDNERIKVIRRNKFFKPKSKFMTKHDKPATGDPVTEKQTKLQDKVLDMINSNVTR